MNHRYLSLSRYDPPRDRRSSDNDPKYPEIPTIFLGFIPGEFPFRKMLVTLILRRGKFDED